MVEPQWSPFRVWTGVGPLQGTLFLNEVYISNLEEEALLIGDVSTYYPLKNLGRFRVADNGCIARVCCKSARYWLTAVP